MIYLKKPDPGGEPIGGRSNGCPENEEMMSGAQKMNFNPNCI
jgi:hypothetical protein